MTKWLELHADGRFYTFRELEDPLAINCIEVDESMEAPPENYVWDIELKTFVPWEVKFPAPPPSQEELLASYEQHLDNYINSRAAERGYDSRITVAMRCGYAGPWQAECIRFAQWMDTCYVYSYQVKDDVLAGRRPAPTKEELILELPTFTW